MTRDEWLKSTQDKRDEMDAFARSPLPIGNDSHGETNKLIENEDAAQRILADAETYLEKYKSQAMFFVRNQHPDLTAKEREKVEVAEVADFKRVVTGIEITAKMISNRRFLSMNQNRSR